MHKESFINCNTLLHVSTLLGHLQGELSVVVTLRLHFIVECECAVVDCVHTVNNSTFSLNYKVQP
jgi:exonuclease I